MFDPEAPPFSLSPDAANWVSKTLQGMGPEEKIGQVLWAYPVGEKHADVARRMVEAGQLSSLCLGFEDLKDPRQAAELINDYQARAPIPLLMNADFEQGVGEQVVRGATFMPYNMALGAAGSEDLAYEKARVIAVEGRAIGVPMPLTPVVDVNVNAANPIIGPRAFGEDPEQVASLAVAYVRGCQENGALAVVKHFPGHGDTDMDSHLDLPRLPHSLDRMEKVELVPYRRAISAGVIGVMSAHIVFEAMDPDLPATLSQAVLTGLLRDRLGFAGLVVTDALAMGAIARHFPPEESTVLALAAGADLLLVDDPEIGYFSLRIGLRDGRVSPKRLDDAVARVLAAKAWLSLHENCRVDPDRAGEICGCEEHRSLARRIAEAAVTLVRGQISPGGRGRGRAALVAARDQDLEGRSLGGYLRDQLARRAEVAFWEVDEAMSEEEVAAGIDGLGRTDFALFAVFPRVHPYRGQIGTSPAVIRAFERLRERARGIVLLCCGSPYVIPSFGGGDAAICTYSHAREAVDVGLEAALGERSCPGRLPVSLRSAS